MNTCEKANFKKVFLKLHPSVESFIISRGANKNEALDIAQESFLRLWEKCKEVTEKSLKSFLFTTADRIFIDQFRKNKTKQKYVATLGWDADLKDGQYQLEMQEFKNHFEEVISAMNEKSREVFMLHRFERWKYREIADQLNISQKTVEKRMHNALMFLSKNKIPKIH